MSELDDDKRRGVSPARIGVWVVVAVVGLYMVISGVLGGLGVIG